MALNTIPLILIPIIYFVVVVVFCCLLVFLFVCLCFVCFCFVLFRFVFFFFLILSYFTSVMNYRQFYDPEPFKPFFLMHYATESSISVTLRFEIIIIITMITKPIIIIFTSMLVFQNPRTIKCTL